MGDVFSSVPNCRLDHDPAQSVCMVGSDMVGNSEHWKTHHPFIFRQVSYILFSSYEFTDNFFIQSTICLLTVPIKLPALSFVTAMDTPCPLSRRSRSRLYLFNFSSFLVLATV